MASGVRTPSLFESLLMLKVFHHVNTIRIASAAMLVDLATVETVEGNQQGAEQVVSYADIHLQQDWGQIQ